MNLSSYTQCDSSAPMHCAAGLVLSILWSSAIFAGLVEVPAAVRPGALRPGEERQSVPQQPPPAVYEVPAIVERPLDIDAGAKIHVASFELLGATDQPEHEIVTKDVQSLMDAKLSSQGDGLTVGRIQEVADAVTQYYRTRGLILAQAFVPVQNVVDGHVKIQVLEGLLGLVQAGQVNQYRGAVDLARGQVVWTGDIFLPSFARSY